MLGVQIDNTEIMRDILASVRANTKQMDANGRVWTIEDYLKYVPLTRLNVETIEKFKIRFENLIEPNEADEIIAKIQNVLDETLATNFDSIEGFIQYLQSHGYTKLSGGYYAVTYSNGNSIVRIPYFSQVGSYSTEWKSLFTPTTTERWDSSVFKGIASKEEDFAYEMKTYAEGYESHVLAGIWLSRLLNEHIHSCTPKINSILKVNNRIVATASEKINGFQIPAKSESEILETDTKSLFFYEKLKSFLSHIKEELNIDIPDSGKDGPDNAIFVDIPQSEFNESLPNCFEYEGNFYRIVLIDLSQEWAFRVSMRGIQFDKSSHK